MRLTHVRAIKIGSLMGSGFRFTGILGGQPKIRRFVFVDS